MSTPTHLIVGPDHHGVTAYALQLAAATGAPVIREQEFTNAELPPGAIHVTFTDHLFGPSPALSVERLLGRVGKRPLSLSLHDIPQAAEGDERFARRAAAYRRLVAAAQVAVVNSRHEAEFFASSGLAVEVIPLPVPRVDSHYAPLPKSVGVLGFIYPGKGHEELLEQLAGSGRSLTFLGTVSAGHEAWAEKLRERAAELGVELHMTGWLDHAALAAAMGRIEVPVCAHRHFSASGSLMTWLGAGRHVLVSDAPYSREIAERYPEQMSLVAPGSWRDAIEGFTPREPVTAQEYGWDEVAARYLRLWWERVSVIIPHYNDHESLARTVAAVRAQDYPGDVEIIVADDGSREVPELPGVTVVTQPDRGFRAAAARNLGAAHATGAVLAFLDADTIPAAGYLRAAVTALGDDPRGVVVGTRTTGPQRQEPEWLRHAWEQTNDLERADDTSWRYIISAVLTCRREFFARLGGFDGTLVGYGGEDWEFGFRAWNAGATFIHAPAARAHHPEPDWGARHEDERVALAEKNAESVALAARITHPIARPPGVVFERADIAVRLPATAADWDTGLCEAVVSAWLAAGDVAVLCQAPPPLFAADPRVRTADSGARGTSALPSAGLWPAEGDAKTATPDESSARIEVILERPLLPPTAGTGPLLDALSRVGALTAPGLRASTARARALGTPARGVDVGCVEVTGPQRLERHFAGW